MARPNMNRVRNSVSMKLAWLLPKQVAYWAGIRLWANATAGPDALNACDVKMDQALTRWGTPPL